MYGMVGVGSNGVNKWNLFDIEWLLVERRF